MEALLSKANLSPLSLPHLLHLLHPLTQNGTKSAQCTMTLYFEYHSVSRYRVDSFRYHRVHSHKVRLVVTTVVTTYKCHTFILNTGSGGFNSGIFRLLRSEDNGILKDLCQKIHSPKTFRAKFKLAWFALYSK